MQTRATGIKPPTDSGTGYWIFGPIQNSIRSYREENLELKFKCFCTLNHSATQATRRKKQTTSIRKEETTKQRLKAVSSRRIISTLPHDPQ
jgi:hypothetical protein